jgi:hypothetical protein
VSSTVLREKADRQLPGSRLSATKVESGRERDMKRFRKTTGVAAVVADLTLLMTGCITGVVDLDDDSHSGNAEASALFMKTVDVENQTTIQVVGGNGAVEVWGVPGATEVTIDAVRRVKSDSQADANLHLDDLQVAVTKGPGEVKVQTVQPDHTGGRTYIVDYEITVPDGLFVRVTNGNGAVRIEGTDGDVQVENGNGDVTLVDVVGNSWIALGNGQLSTDTFLPDEGEIIYAVGNGTILLAVQPQVSADFEAKVGNGSISLTGLDLQQVVTTPRHLQGKLGTGTGRIDLSLGNGTVQVTGR